jgi:hypothetical protein
MLLVLAGAGDCRVSGTPGRTPEAVVSVIFDAMAADDVDTVKALVSADLTRRIERETGFADWVQSRKGHALISIDGPPNVGPVREWGVKATLPATWKRQAGNQTVRESGEIKLRSPDGKTWYWDDF